MHATEQLVLCQVQHAVASFDDTGGGQLNFPEFLIMLTRRPWRDILPSQVLIRFVRVSAAFCLVRFRGLHHPQAHQLVVHSIETILISAVYRTGRRVRWTPSLRLFSARSALVCNNSHLWLAVAVLRCMFVTREW